MGFLRDLVLDGTLLRRVLDVGGFFLANFNVGDSKLGFEEIEL